LRLGFVAVKAIDNNGELVSQSERNETGRRQIHLDRCTVRKYRPTNIETLVRVPVWVQSAAGLGRGRESAVRAEPAAACVLIEDLEEEYEGMIITL
jgi:hypothetical protein